MNFYRKTFVLTVALSLQACMSMTQKPLTNSEVDSKVKEDLKNIFSDVEPMPKRFDLYNAMARAVKYNLEYRQAKLESVIARSDFNTEKYNLLPDLVANAGYIDRNNQLEVLSPSGGVSTSQDKIRNVNDLQLSWNILDFGITYFNSKQKANDAYIKTENQREVLGRILRDTRKYYAKAFAYQELKFKSPRLYREIKSIINKTWKMQSEKLISPEKGARFRLELWQNYNTIHQIEKELSSASSSLKNLINAPIISHAHMQNYANYNLPKGLPLNNTKLINIALNNRPELKASLYKEKYDIAEVNKTFLEIFPNLPIKLGHFYDSNSFFQNSSWTEFSSFITWNLLKIPSKIQNYKTSKGEVQLSKLKTMSLEMLIMTQVAIAKTKYIYSRDSLHLTYNSLVNAKNLLSALEDKKSARLSKEIELIRVRAKYLEIFVKYQFAKALEQEALGELLNSIGYEQTYRLDTINKPIAEIAKDIRDSVLNVSNKKIETETIKIPAKKVKVINNIKKVEAKR